MNMRDSKQPWSGFLAYCHICKVKLDPGRLEVVFENKDKRLLHTECRRCRSNILIVIAPLPRHPFYASVVVLTDMSKQDVLRARRLKPLSPDDVLEVHQHFKK